VTTWWRWWRWKERKLIRKSDEARMTKRERKTLCMQNEISITYISGRLTSSYA
jgi:hypothetical protein